MEMLSEKVLEGLAVKANYNARQLAQLCHMTTRQLQRTFMRKLGISPQNWLNEQRINAAKQLLLSGRTVKEVTFDLGFKQVSHFCRRFKSHLQLTPLQYVAVVLDQRNQIPPLADSKPIVSSDAPLTIFKTSCLETEAAVDNRSEPTSGRI